jgi:hypothetical protein
VAGAVSAERSCLFQISGLDATGNNTWVGSMNVNYQDVVAGVEVNNPCVKQMSYIPTPASLDSIFLTPDQTGNVNYITCFDNTDEATPQLSGEAKFSPDLATMKFIPTSGRLCMLPFILSRTT